MVENSQVKLLSWFILMVVVHDLPSGPGVEYVVMTISQRDEYNKIECKRIGGYEALIYNIKLKRNEEEELGDENAHRQF